MKFTLTLIVVAFLFLFPPRALAIPTQYGDSGLFSQPTAETLNAGNICLGLWANCTNGEEGGATLVPVALTLGLGTFIEMYGSYPNLLFNGDEGNLGQNASGRGFANIGMKIRLWGKRSAAFKLATDLQARRSISDDPDFDGINDYLGRVVVSYKPGRFGIHLNGGYIQTGDAAQISSEDQTIYGGGIELYPLQRLRLIAEVEKQTARFGDGDDPLEATAAFQYYLSPHLTLNVGFGYGLSDASPEWRALVGLTTCQGIGTYSRPIPRKIEPIPEEAPKEPVKALKVKPLTPLIPKTPAAPAAPVGRFEVPLESAEEVVVLPAEKLVVAEAASLAALPVAAIAETGNAAVVPAVPVSPAEEPIKTSLYRMFRLPEFNFAHDQWSLSPAGEAAILEIAEQLRSEEKFFIIKVDGHTDSVGPENYNLRLSQNRATSAALALVVKAGFDPNRIFLRGHGESKPLASNETVEGRATNRRVELLILLPKEDIR